MQIVRAFHIIHGNGSVYEFYNEDTNTATLYHHSCEDNSDLGLQIPELIKHCGLSHGIRNTFLVDRIVDISGRKIELWAIYPDARTVTRNKSGEGAVFGRWVKPEVLAAHADIDAGQWISGYQQKNLWTHDDMICHLLPASNG